MSNSLNNRYKTPATRPVLITRPVSKSDAASRPIVSLGGSARPRSTQLVSFAWSGIASHGRR